MVIAGIGRRLRRRVGERIDETISGHSEHPRRLGLMQRKHISPIRPGKEREPTPEVMEMGEHFREGLARRIGVEPGEISSGLVDKWARDYFRALTRRAQQQVLFSVAEEAAAVGMETMRSRGGLAQRYVQGMARFSGKSEEEVRKSKMARNFNRRIYE